MKIYIKISFIILIIMSLMLIYLYIQKYSIIISNYAIKINNLPHEFNQFKILHISDIHNKQFGKNQADLLKKIDECKFDIIVITGDIVNKRSPEILPIKQLLNKLSDKPIYFVSGNHEWQIGYAEIKKLLLDHKVNILENDSIKLIQKDEHIWLLGIHDTWSKKDNLDNCLKKINDNNSKILLSHQPNILNSATNSNIDLILSGHTHAGQFRIPLINKAIFAPGEGLFPKYDYGMFTQDNTKMIISAGLGESVIPFRINNKPEISVITLEGIDNK